VEGGRQLAAFPPPAKRAIWNLLAPALEAPGSPRAEASLDAFRREHSLEPAATVAAVQGVLFLLRHASALNLPLEAFRQDLAALCANDAEIQRVLLARCEATRAALRSELLEATLADHGKVFAGLDWRLDTVSTSDRAVDLGAGIIFLTLRYREGDRLDRLTLQLTPAALRELKAFADRFQE